MMGSMFAGCDEAPGTFELYQGRKYKVYRGMGSIATMENGSKDRYFQEGAKSLFLKVLKDVWHIKVLLRILYSSLSEESVQEWVTADAKISNYLKRMENSLRLQQRSLKESHPHDIHITKEAPNYSR